jgi:hypothetical protein
MTTRAEDLRKMAKANTCDCEDCSERRTMLLDFAAALDLIETLAVVLEAERLEVLWNAYHTGHNRADGQWSHSFMSDGEWLVRECDMDPQDAWFSNEAIRAAIPLAAARFARAALTPKEAS